MFEILIEKKQNKESVELTFLQTGLCLGMCMS